jgi:hypothetical protein
MKNIFYLIFGILITSCSSSKLEERVVIDFLIDNPFFKNEEVRIVAEQPINRLLSLEYYEKAYEDRNIRLGDMIRISPESYASFKWPLDTIEVKILKEIYKNEPNKQLWKKNDFRKTKIKLIPSDKILETINDISHQYFGKKGLEISKPLITSNKKYAFLFVRTFNIGIPFGHSIVKAILMENINGKWKIIETFIDPNVIS